MDDMVIHEVEPAKADAVLTVRLSIPGVTEGAEDRFYLARTEPRRRTSVVESVTRNPDGSTTTVSTSSSEEVGWSALCTHADGRTADGRGCGHGRTVSIESPSADAVTVHMSMSWTDRHGRRGSLDEELLVPWLGTARREVAGGWIEGSITRIANRVEFAAFPPSHRSDRSTE